jgi:hypothetical protein
MLSRQIYTPKHSEHVGKDVLSFEYESSPYLATLTDVMPKNNMGKKLLSFHNSPTQVVPPCSGNNSNAYLYESAVLRKTPYMENMLSSISFAYENKFSTANPRTPTSTSPAFFTLDHYFGALECPTSPQNKIKHEIDTLDNNENTTAIPSMQYTMHLSCDSFDPNIVNTPPNEFMNQLKSRLDVYYSQ